MAGSLKAEDEELAKIESMGLLTDHTYGIIDIYELDHNSETL